MKNIVIYGGGFDPIHNGHINMAINASKALDAEVFFVPAKIAVWKERTHVDGLDKAKMIELAIKEVNNPHLHLSLVEVNSDKDMNYSIDTAKSFIKDFPDSKIYLLIGADQANQFYKWKDAEELARLVQVVVIERPGYPIDEEIIKKFNIQLLKTELYDISSSDIRRCKNLNVPYSVLDYILEHELYFVKKVKSYMKERRYLHSVSVARLAYEIAIANNIDRPWRYFIAGLLHDIGKDIPLDEQKEIVEKHFSEYKDMPIPIIHQFAGSYLAKNEFGIKDPDILEAIEYHTTGHPDMKTMAKVIYAADKIDPTRGFDSTDLIQAMKVNVDDGFMTVLSANRDYFIKKNIQYDNPLTAATMKKFLG